MKIKFLSVVLMGFMLSACKSDVDKCVDALIAESTESNAKKDLSSQRTKAEIEAESRVWCLRAAAGK